MPLFEITETSMSLIPSTNFGSAGLRERTDLQRLLRDRIDAIAPETMVLAEEFGDWEDSRRRIDLLLLDRDANLVVCELKRTEDGGHLELQAIRYAAMVSTMTFRQAVDAHSEYLRGQQSSEDAEQQILSFLGWQEPDDELFAPEVRIVLASQNFSKEVTSSVLWLNGYGLDIRCVRMIPHSYGEHVILDVQQVVPLPEAQEYQVQVRQKEQVVRVARGSRAVGSSEDRHIRFWSTLLEKSQARHGLHVRIKPSKGNWIAATVSGLYFAYVIANNQGRVELYFPGPNADENLRIFNTLRSKREQIEKTFGSELDWQPLEGKTACRIAYFVDGGSPKDEDSWDSLQANMVDAMVRLELAFTQSLQEAVGR